MCSFARHGSTTSPRSWRCWLPNAGRPWRYDGARRIAGLCAAFRRIVASPNDTLYVAELDGEVVGTFQTTIIPSMVGRGGNNLKIEAVQTSAEMRGKGIGAAMMRFAIERAGRPAPGWPN